MTEIANPFPGEVLEEMGAMRNYNEWIVGQFAAKLGGRAVEIGAGLGTISERLRPLVQTLDLRSPHLHLPKDCAKSLLAMIAAPSQSRPWKAGWKRQPARSTIPS